MALLDINGWGKNPIVENIDNTPLDIKGFEVGEDFSSPSNKLQQMKDFIEGYLASLEKKYSNISSKDPENLSLRMVRGEMIAAKRILEKFFKESVEQEANPPMKKMR